MAKTLNVLALQMSSILGNKVASLKKAETILNTYDCERPDVVILPEVFAIGCAPELFKENAEEDESSLTLNFLSQLAKHFDAHVIGGSYIRKVGDNYYNSMPIVNPNGKVVQFYDKMHLFFGDWENEHMSPGQTPLIVKINGVKIGVSICYDIRFPELYRAYSRQGAQVLVNAAAWPPEKANQWHVLSRARAIENQAFYLAVNQTGKIKKNQYNFGHSMIIDPWGNIKTSIEDDEGMISTMLNMDELAEFRKDFPILKDTKEEYKPLIKEI